MTRADHFLVEQGFAASRSEAQAAIRAGLVRVDGNVLAKPSKPIIAGAAIEYRKPHPFVSRGGVKLAAALEHFSLSPEGRIALDIGASTGGFTEVLLAGGAEKVYAIDVGHAQMNAALARDRRVTVRDGVNARDLTETHVPQAPQAITADVSFIGLKLVLPPALALAANGAWLVALVKPQFEVGRDWVGKGGIVRDTDAQEAALRDIEGWIGSQKGWSILGSIESPIQGGDGNKEFLDCSAEGVTRLPAFRRLRRLRAAKSLAGCVSRSQAPESDRCPQPGRAWIGAAVEETVQVPPHFTPACRFQASTKTDGDVAVGFHAARS